MSALHLIENLKDYKYLMDKKIPFVDYVTNF
jgi:hypothetical protein